MKRHYTTAEVEIDPVEVLDELSVQEITAYLCKRDDKGGDPPDILLRRTYEHYRLKGDCPPDLREYFWQVLGRYL